MPEFVCLHKFPFLVTLQVSYQHNRSAPPRNVPTNCGSPAWGEGAIREHPHGTICHISPPPDDYGHQPHLRLVGGTNASPKDLPGEFAVLGQTLIAAGMLQPATDWAERAVAQAERLNDDDDGSAVL